MRRTVSIILAILLCAALIVSCDADKASTGGGGTPDQPSTPEITVNMTESYKAAWIKFHDLTGIWLPQLENVELLDTSVINDSAHVQVNFIGTSDQFASLGTCLKTAIPVSTEIEEAGFRFYWEYFIDASGKSHPLADGRNGMKKMINFDLMINQGTNEITLGFWLRTFHTVSISATSGGSVTLKQEPNTYTDNTITTTINDRVDITATPAEGCTFTGWYIGETKISDEAALEYKITGDAVITAKFREPEMTESYKAARQRIHESSGIWIPALNGIDLSYTDISEDLSEKPLVNIGFAGDEALFNQFVAFFTEAIRKEPDQDMDTLKWWEMQYTESGKKYVGNISVSISNSGISIASHFFRGFTVTITVNPAEGGTALIYPGGSNDGVSSLTEAEKADTNLGATPAEGYTFTGWYLGDTLISDKATVWDYKIPSQDVTIEARFAENKEVSMTDTYSSGRDALKAFSGIEIAALEDVGCMTEQTSDMTMLDITGADGDDFSCLLADLKESLGDPDQTLVEGTSFKWNLKTIDEGVVYLGQITASFVQSDSMIVIVCNLSADYYATGRQKLIDWDLITLPEIEGLGSEDFTIEEGIGWWTSDADICFDFDSGVTEDAYNAIKACIEELCGTTQTEGKPRIDYDDENPGQIVQIDNWWAYNGKRYNLCFNIANEGLYFNIIQSN